ncbi:TPA: hypothetical protein ACH3X3_006403 [Trebouxia sp. C0006]
MTVFQFAENFWQPDEPDRRTLGQGGASNGVERCFVRATGEEFAAKRLSVRQQKSLPLSKHKRNKWLDPSQRVSSPARGQIHRAISTANWRSLSDPRAC